MYDENMIRDKHMRNAINRIYKKNKTLYVTGGRARSVLLFKNVMEHLNEYLQLKNRIEKDQKAW